jgi:hypothetical protein
MTLLAFLQFEKRSVHTRCPPYQEVTDFAAYCFLAIGEFVRKGDHFLIPNLCIAL